MENKRNSNKFFFVIALISIISYYIYNIYMNKYETDEKQKSIIYTGIVESRDNFYTFYSFKLDKNKRGDIQKNLSDKKYDLYKTDKSTDIFQKETNNHYSVKFIFLIYCEYKNHEIDNFYCFIIIPKFKFISYFNDLGEFYVFKKTIVDLFNNDIVSKIIKLVEDKKLPDNFYIDNKYSIKFVEDESVSK